MMKSNYWSCSKFADWLRGTTKPAVGTSEEWDAWRKHARAKILRYWLAEEGLDHLQNFIYWPANRFHGLRCYIKNRWITKSHALTSSLKRGNWYDFDTRLLHAAFDELVNFVEIEQAWMLVISSKDDSKKYKTPWYRTIFSFKRWRNPEAGVAHLDWAAGLKNDDNWMDKNDPDFGQPTQQALAARETFALYKWWKEERPKRTDPSEASGWNEYCKKKRETDESIQTRFVSQKMKDHLLHEILELSRKIEDEYDKEVTAMLMRLVKVRQSLWT